MQRGNAMSHMAYGPLSETFGVADISPFFSMGNMDPFSHAPVDNYVPCFDSTVPDTTFSGEIGLL